MNTSQQVGGSIGTALLNTVATTASSAYVAAHGPWTTTIEAEAAVHGYAVVYRWSAGFFLFGGGLALVLFRRRVRPGG
ncbi:hypothetical protein ACQP1G_42595 [Nocardia sp. CA-107356]|uniref:hypothetical protein n=1 Tax=Nocardia sp. CA-107356 TaxID=3239972 RepID=UPI003D937356